MRTGFAARLFAKMVGQPDFGGQETLADILEPSFHAMNAGPLFGNRAPHVSNELTELGNGFPGAALNFGQRGTLAFTNGALALQGRLLMRGLLCENLPEHQRQGEDVCGKSVGLAGRHFGSTPKAVATPQSQGFGPTKRIGHVPADSQVGQHWIRLAIDHGNQNVVAGDVPVDDLCIM